MKVLRKFEDSRYTLVEAVWKGSRFIYLKDRKQKTESLGTVEKEPPLGKMWKKHLEVNNYCIPCELLLYLKHKVLKAENSIAELGLTLEKLKEFSKTLAEVERENS